MESKKEVNGWNEWSRYVRSQLEGNSITLKELKEGQFDLELLIQKEVAKLHEELVTLKTEMKMKAGVWGLLAGLIPVVITLVILLLNRSI